MIAYGHASIKYDGRKFDFIPSFKNIEKIGTPEQIIKTFELLNIPHFDKTMFTTAMHVLECCIEGEDKDLSKVFGYISPNYHGDKMLWVSGAEPFQNALIMARHMLMHGVCGESDTIDKSEAKPVTEFNASEFVAAARRVLEVSIDEAKNMTMTELLMLCKDVKESAENEEKAEKGTPTQKEHKDTMDWLAKVNAARDKQAANEAE